MQANSSPLFEALDTIARRKLFVGMTRARMRLIMVMSERAGRVVAGEPLS